MIFIGLRPRERKDTVVEVSSSSGAQGTGAQASGERRARIDSMKPSDVQVWHAKDVRIIPMQKSQEQQDVQRTLLAAWHLESGRVTSIGTDLLETARVLAQLENTRANFNIEVEGQDFHAKVAEIAGNASLQRLLGELFERIVLKQRVAAGQLDRGKDAWLQHRAILAAIRDRKPNEARRQALYHVRKSKQLAMLRLQEEADYLKNLRIVG